MLVFEEFKIRRSCSANGANHRYCERCLQKRLIHFAQLLDCSSNTRVPKRVEIGLRLQTANSASAIGFSAATVKVDGGVKKPPVVEGQFRAGRKITYRYVETQMSVQGVGVAGMIAIIHAFVARLQKIGITPTSDRSMRVDEGPVRRAPGICLRDFAATRALHHDYSATRQLARGVQPDAAAGRLSEFDTIENHDGNHFSPPYKSALSILARVAATEGINAISLSTSGNNHIVPNC